MESHDCKYEEDIGYIKATLNSINDKLRSNYEEIQAHIMQGEGWRKAIVGIIFAGFVQIVSFAYLFGTLSHTVQEHENRFSRVNEREVQLLDIINKDIKP
jgi:hypothetical protein